MKVLNGKYNNYIYKDLMTEITRFINININHVYQYEYILCKENGALKFLRLFKNIFLTSNLIVGQLKYLIRKIEYSTTTWVKK